ncbi:unnamed protein product [Periconia digitata]|uniref:Uncharacterized protein n=1 Tax=Periconia digitata TaxID=1303443 RepID=A0A9W4U803_9PLEO|nr:unnamed protein product [Periconia digitata]
MSNDMIVRWQNIRTKLHISTTSEISIIDGKYGWLKVACHLPHATCAWEQLKNRSVTSHAANLPLLAPNRITESPPRKRNHRGCRIYTHMSAMSRSQLKNGGASEDKWLFVYKNEKAHIRLRPLQLYLDVALQI